MFFEKGQGFFEKGLMFFQADFYSTTESAFAHPENRVFGARVRAFCDLPTESLSVLQFGVSIKGVGVSKM
jgi:hypothetical protein